MGRTATKAPSAAAAARVVFGMDPHKRSVTVEVIAADEEVLGGGRYATDRGGFGVMVGFAKRWPQRVWAIAGCSGSARPCESVHDAGRVHGTQGGVDRRSSHPPSARLGAGNYQPWVGWEVGE